MDTQTIADRLRELDCDQVKIVGQDVMCCCPFHPEREPSFGVHPDKGANCFACHVRFHDTEKMFEVLSDKRGVDYTPPYRSLPDDWDIFPLDEHEPEPLNANVVKFYKKDAEYFQREWGISEDVVERRGLCLDPTTGAECFPIFDKKNQYWGMVERHVGGFRRRYHYPANYPRRNILFGEDEANKFREEIWVVEGVRDLCAVESKVSGIRAVALGTSRITEEQIETMRGYEKLVLCLDNDEAGRHGREFLLGVLPSSKTWIAKYEGKDPMDAYSFEVRASEIYWMV